MKTESLYLRLLEKEESHASDDERLQAARLAVESACEIRCKPEPRMHPRGGLCLFFADLEPSDKARLIAILDRAGYLVVI